MMAGPSTAIFSIAACIFLVIWSIMQLLRYAKCKHGGRHATAEITKMHSVLKVTITWTDDHLQQREQEILLASLLGTENGVEIYYDDSRAMPVGLTRLYLGTIVAMLAVATLIILTFF